MEFQETRSEDSAAKMESDDNNSGAANYSDPNIDINVSIQESVPKMTSDDEDLLEEKMLNEKIRAAEEFARELKLRNRTKMDLKFVLDTESAYGNESDEVLEGKLLDDKNRAAEKCRRKRKHRNQTNIDLTSDLVTATTDDGNRSEDKLLNEKIRATEPSKEIELQNTTKNIVLKSDLGTASAYYNDESLEDLLEEQLLNERMRAAEEFGRELKLRNRSDINFQCNPSVSGVWNSKSVEGDLDVHKLLNDDSRKNLFNEKSKDQQLDIVNKALSSNLYKQAFLSKWEKSVEEVLKQNLNLQDRVVKIMKRGNKDQTRVVRLWNNYTTAVFGMSYFKEKNKKMSCPPNADTKQRIENGHPLTPDPSDSGKWTKKETNLLKQGVQSILTDKTIASLKSQIDCIENANKKKTALSKVGNQVDRLNEKIKKVKTMSLKELMSEQDIDDDYDWKVISVNTFKGFRDPVECQSYFKLCLDPFLNHNSWSKEEDEKLAALAEKYSCQDWDKIAIELGTNRSGYECCLHFEREMDKNVRASGKWTEEEDNRLIEAVKTFRVGNHIPWTKISFSFTQRSVAQLRARWTESLAPHRKKGKFSPEEDKIIFETIEKHGCSFGAVASLFPNRTAPQIRARFQRKMEKLQIRGHWTLEEDKLLMELVDKIGIPKWKKISEHFITRTRTQVRQRYNSIKDFLEKYPTLGIEDIIRRSKKSGNSTMKTEPKSETTDTNSAIIKSETTDKDSIHKNLPSEERNKRKRKSTVSESSSLDGDKPIKQMKKSCSTDNSSSRFDSILKLLRRKREAKPLSPTGLKLISYFQETYPMQALVGKKNWAETDISSEAQVIFDLSHILRVDFSYIDDSRRLGSVSPFMLRQTVKRLIENHSDNLLRLNPVDAEYNYTSLPPQTCQTNPETDLIDVTDATSHIDCPPVPVEDSICSDLLFLDDSISEDQHAQSSKNNVSQYPIEKNEIDFDLVEKQKREFMKFPYLIPPNVATAVGYRSLLLIERKLKNIANDETLTPDYSSYQFRMKDEDKVLAKIPTRNQCNMEKCVRFTRNEAINMFKERLKILFAVPMVMGECAERYFDASHLPIYRKDVALNRNKRRTNSTLYEDLHKSKLTCTSNSNQISDDDYESSIEITDDSCGVYSMPSLDGCLASTSSSIENNDSSSNIPDNCDPSTSKILDNFKPGTSFNSWKLNSSGVKRSYMSRRSNRSIKPKT